MGVKTGNRGTLPAMLAERVECKNAGGTVRGTERFSGCGRLPREYVSALLAAYDAGRLLYVVYSYATPIAWVEKNAVGEPMWAVPGVKYSVTTTGHQSMARYAAQRSNAYANV